jgi:hypothetical protein
MRPPIIIIGMHRSGTSILAKILEKSGIFMGVLKEHNYEAMHFLSINQQVLWKTGSHWHKPKVAKAEYWSKITAQELYKEHFRLNGRLAKWKQILRNESWGWKDPRNSYTLEMWLDKFPEAKVIHLVRNRESVIRSLQNRNARLGEVQEPELDDINFCSSLYKGYVDQCRSYSASLGTRYLECSFEDLQQMKPSAIRALEAFTGKALKVNFEKYLR